MGFLNLPGAGINMAKATVSFWFRIPKETIDRVNANPPPRGGAYGYSEAATWPVLQWQMTLLSWGEQIQAKVWWWTQQQVGIDNSGGFVGGGPGTPIMGLLPTDTQTGPMAPSYIGLEFMDDKAHVVVNLQGTSMSHFQNVVFADYINKTFVGTPGVSGFPSTDINHVDASYTLDAPVAVGSGTPGLNTGEAEERPDIATDTWHHLLLSWDVTGSISCGGDSTAINSSFKMYFALDDENYDEGALPARWIGNEAYLHDEGAAGNDPHTVVSNDDRLTTLPWPAGAGSSDPAFTENATPAGSFSGTIGSLATPKMYVPGSPQYTDGGRTVNSVYKVEMAELQIFTGIMLDTSNETNRRAFVTSAGKPEKPAVAEQWLGKRPEVLLHGTANWKQGKNTGSIGVEMTSDGDEQIIPSGQFIPAGTIVKYKPDPSLTEKPTA